MSKKILIIDDQPIMLKFIEHYFIDKYELVSMQSARKALEYMHSGYTPDLVIVDLHMPGFNGFDFLKSVRVSAYFVKIPIIVLSGADGSADRIEALKLGANDYVTKPFNPEELKLRIDNIISIMSHYAF